MTPLLARDPTSDACFFNAFVMFFHGVGFRLRAVKAMACGSVVQSAHVPIYEQLLSRSDFRQFLGACNAGFVESWLVFATRDVFFATVFVWFGLRSFRDLDIRHI